MLFSTLRLIVVYTISSYNACNFSELSWCGDAMN